MSKFCGVISKKPVTQPHRDLLPLCIHLMKETANALSTEIEKLQLFYEKKNEVIQHQQEQLLENEQNRIRIQQKLETLAQCLETVEKEIDQHEINLKEFEESMRKLKMSTVAQKQQTPEKREKQCRCMPPLIWTQDDASELEMLECTGQAVTRINAALEEFLRYRKKPQSEVYKILSMYGRTLQNFDESVSTNREMETKNIVKDTESKLFKAPVDNVCVISSMNPGILPEKRSQIKFSPILHLAENDRNKNILTELCRSSVKALIFLISYSFDNPWKYSLIYEHLHLFIDGVRSSEEVCQLGK